MKSVMLSIQPKWCEKIVKGEKTIEVRKSRPKIETPFKCYIYCTKDKRLVCKFDKGEDCYGDVLKEPLYVHRHCWINDNIVDGKVIGEFVCDKAYSIKNRGGSFVVANEEQSVTNKIARQSCLDYDDMVSYLGNKNGYGWHISDLKIYDKPKELGEFERPCSYKGTCYYCVRAKFESDGTLLCDNKITRPPQSWQYTADEKYVKAIEKIKKREVKNDKSRKAKEP